jgi:hypothetical protein
VGFAEVPVRQPITQPAALDGRLSGARPVEDVEHLQDVGARCAFGEIVLRAQRLELLRQGDIDR